MAAALLVLSLPIVDLLLAIMRGFLRREPVCGGGRGHIHHRLLDRGFSARKAVLVLYGLCGVAAVFSLFQSVAVNHFAAAVIVVFCGIAWIGIQNLGYAEFDQARRLILAGGFRQALNSSLTLRAVDQALTQGKTKEKGWAILRGSFRKI